MSYSPSAQTAWESVYDIQFQTQGGWLLRGIHHFMSQAMVVLLALHLMQVVIDGAYRAPREVNFWLGLILMMIVLGLSLTGYLLPWDQKGYWATRVATNLCSLVPVFGKSLQQLVVGGPDYGHHTLTRFFALHAGVLPALLVAFLVLHVVLFRRHGITVRQPLKKPEATFWPEQVMRDAVACLAVLAVVLLLVVHFSPMAALGGKLSPHELGAELGAPADPSSSYSAARPEWYFLFLFQFLKFFDSTNEVLGAIVIPGLLMLVLFLMPLVGRWKLGHRFNIGFLLVLLIGVGLLTGMAVREDYRSRWTDAKQYAEIAELSRKLGHDEEKIKAEFGVDDARIADYQRRLADYEAYCKSEEFLASVKQADADAKRAVELASGPNKIPSTGALAMMRGDAMVQGPRLFAQYCANCHSYFKPSEADSRAALEQLAKASASNLYGFGSREWIAGLLNPKSIAGPQYFGCTTRYKELKAQGKSMEMVEFVQGDLTKWPAEEVDDVADYLSSQSGVYKHPIEIVGDKIGIMAGQKLIADDTRCASCHRFKPDLPFNDPQLLENEMDAPDLTHYASRDWTIGMISNPAAPRFYGKQNDRMPAFSPVEPKADASGVVDKAAAEEAAAKNILSRQQVEQVVDWLRRDYFELPKQEEKP
jgi:ubiquinol-cytochrome c reductase cytochrome b subunit